MTARAALLAVTSAVGLLLARALDGLGLLPGVAEDAAVRRAALDPAWTALGVLLCLAVGALAAVVVRRSRLLAVGVLVAAQLGLVVGLEEAARSVSGAAGGGNDTGLWVAAAGQLLLGLLAVGTALVVVLTTPRSSASWPTARRSLGAGFPPYQGWGSKAERRGWSGRGPPVVRATRATS
jgi:hypothetical protein